MKINNGGTRSFASHRNGLNGRLRSGTNAADALFFFRNFLRYPNMIGWALPSSRFVVDDVLEHVDWSSAKVIVEYGPGLGTFTSRILERMHPGARLIVFEINREFIGFLRRSYADERLHIQECSAENVDVVLESMNCPQADCVISGIPFRPLPHEVRSAIVQKTRSVLRPGGKFLVYQFSNAVLPYLKQSFKNVSCGREFLNLVPTRLFFCERQDASVH